MNYFKITKSGFNFINFSLMADLNIVGCNWIEIPAGKYSIRQMMTRGITQQLKLQSRWRQKAYP
jgi:hypothetical protein